MLTPKEYIGPLMELAQERRGEFQEMKFITEIRASITYALPLAEVSLSHFNAEHRCCILCDLAIVELMKRWLVMISSDCLLI